MRGDIIGETMHNQERELEKYDKWRIRANKHLPELARRVFALRNVHYNGCGFHWGMERTLGFLIWKMSDFDDCQIDPKDVLMRHIVLEVKMNGLFKNIVAAEKSTTHEEEKKIWSNSERLLTSSKLLKEHHQTTNYNQRPFSTL